MANDMFGNTMWAGHWLWMLVIAIVVVVPAWRMPAHGLSGLDGHPDTDPHRQPYSALFHRVCGLASRQRGRSK